LIEIKNDRGLVEIKMNIKASSNSKIHMISSGFFGPKGHFQHGISEYFSEESFPINAGSSKEVSFVFDSYRYFDFISLPGEYTLMIGAENDN
jgi:hypothetical protein